MNYNSLKQLLIVISSSVLVACATHEESPDTAAYEGESRGRDCISQSTIRDYRVLDDSNLIVTASGRRKYHVTLTRRAFGLRSSWHIGFKSDIGRICDRSGELLVGDGMGMTDSIRVRSVRELDPDEVDDLLIRFGKKEPEFEQAPATEKVDGAEVEELD